MSALRPRRAAPSRTAGTSQAAPGPGGVGTVLPDVRIPCTVDTLDNGLTVIVHEDRALPVVSVNVWYHVGSKDERPGRTGLAHLFEHLMFEGSAHVPGGHFDRLLEDAGGVSNGSTTTDRTNYWETVPSTALELALWLESDRMGWLLEAVTEAKLDVQRSVVKNERRQSCENRPYGLAWETLTRQLYPADHPYHWPVIGTMADLDATTLDDVGEFFRTWYAPNNASIAVAGDIAPDRARELVARYFGDIPPGPEPTPGPVPSVSAHGDRRVVLEDDVRLPRLYLAWPGAAHFGPDDAALDVLGSLLADGKSSRLHERLVYRERVAQDVSAFHEAGELGGAFLIVATAKPGGSLDALEARVREELSRVAAGGADADEVDRVIAPTETGFVRALERVGGFGGKADRLNEYHTFVGDADWAARDLARYRRVGPGDLTSVAGRFLDGRPGVVLSVVPRDRTDLAAGGAGGGP